jgi:hypothetical protein
MERKPENAGIAALKLVLTREGEIGYSATRFVKTAITMIFILKKIPSSAASTGY